MVGHKDKYGTNYGNDEAMILSPLTPEAPKRLKRNPPIMAPTIPKMMSRKSRDPDLGFVAKSQGTG